MPIATIGTHAASTSTDTIRSQGYIYIPPRTIIVHHIPNLDYNVKSDKSLSFFKAIIDHNPRRGEKIEFPPAKALRYNERTAVERVNSHLHDAHGGRHVRVRGPLKMAAHLSFGLVVIAAEQMLRMLG